MTGDRVTVGVLSPLLAGTYFGELLKGIAGYVATQGGRVLAVQTLDAALGDHYLGPSQFRTPVSWEVADGFIVVTRAAPDDYLRRLQASGKPLVMVSHHVEGIDCPEVRPDNRSGVADAVSHLVGHGHTRIAFVGDLSNADVAERYEGYRQSLARHSIDASPDLLFRVDDLLEEGGCRAAAEIIERGLPCTAVVTGNDQNALGLVRTVKESGIRVPGDLAVIGFDDVDFASQVSPPLASVRQNFDRVSETAARLLVQMLRGGQVPAGEHRVPTSLAARESCGCVRRPTAVLALPGDASTPARRFAANLTAALSRLAPGVEDGGGLQAAVQRFVDSYEAAASSLAMETGPLTGLAEAVFHLYPRPETVPAVMEALTQYRTDLLALEFSHDRLSVLDRCANEVLLAISAAQMRLLAEVNDKLQTSLRNEYYVSMGLVGLRIGIEGLHSEGIQARSLEWMAGTQAHSACLGLWTQEGRGTHQALRVAGHYGAAAAQALVAGAEIPAEHFPPIEALTGGPFEAGDLVYVLPVRTASRDWGMLAVAGPPEAAAKTGRDIYFQWAALVGVALDHDALVDSLERQRRDLAEAYLREQGLAAEVRASEERYALAASAVNDGLWDWDVAGATVFFSPRWKALLGYADDQIGRSPSEWLSRAHPDDSKALHEAVEGWLGGREEPLCLEHRLLGRDGTVRWFMCRATALRGPDGEVVRMVGSLTDVTDRKHLEERLRHAALYDSLTGLPNRSLFTDRLGQAVARARRSPGHHFSVLFLDLDGFKSVNDTYGHVSGDLLLVEVARRITAHLRDNDTPVRFGGDEFAVLLDGVTGPDQVDAVTRRLRAALCLPYWIEGQQVVVTATVGTANSTDGYDDPERIIRAADDAMYRAKQRLKGPVPCSPPVPIAGR